MNNCEEDITYSKCHFFDDSKVESIQEEFRKICKDNSGSQKCFTETQDYSEYCNCVSEQLNKLQTKLKEMLQIYQGESSNIMSNENTEDVKKQCLCLKNSFYNNVIKVVKEETNVYELFKRCNFDIIDKKNGVPSTLCTFRNLNIRGMERIKSIYDFYLFYYSNIKDLTVDQKLDKPPNGYKKGFYEHCNGIIHCLNEKSNSEYCDEFKEYHNYYNAFKVFLEGLIFYGKEADGSDCNNGCVLAESLLKGQYLLELRKEIKRIKSKYRSTNYSTTAITITPREFWVRIRKLKNKEAHINVDDETEDKSLFTSENQENDSKNKGYSISYKSVKYS
ncbi:PIR Superfamily Protein [Plasmodium ovale curtisi]|uniref:PIR Superfamily Protein n=1 Tax=Plasmodium ovale curtisi TaxID=864141 RepID=A0A1A8WJX4_PLAOA|nr:PIR Superfamily Protein [Plasmodium ovale curtisi]